MAVVEKSALVPHSASQMYALVNAVETYPDFLPWCAGAAVLSEEPGSMCARIEVSRAGVHQVFSTCNQLFADERIELQLQDGPFKRLHGTWNFVPLREDASKVSLRLEFEFSGRLINAAFGGVFSHIANNLVDAFCKRATEVYGVR
ncbi:MAG: type II toxin-antitoxin system RatA family toxin [Pseudomonadota bacterium]